MSVKRPVSGLGRGLSALMGEARRRRRPTSRRPVARRRARDRDRPDPPQSQPAAPACSTEESIDELADSIAERGVLQPILLRPHGDGFEIIAGERRWRAAQRARLHSIPAIVRDIDDAATAEIALIENIQREDLNAIEEAEGYRQLIEQHGHSQEDVGRLVHKSRSHVANLLRLLDLAAVRPRCADCAAISAWATPGRSPRRPIPRAWPSEIIAKGLSVRQAEARARRAKQAGRRAVRDAEPRGDRRPRGARAPAGRHARPAGQGRAQRRGAAPSRCTTTASTSST